MKLSHSMKAYLDGVTPTTLAATFIGVMQTTMLICALSLTVVSVKAETHSGQVQTSTKSSQKSTQKKSRRVKRSATLRPIIYKKLEQVRVLADEKHYVQAEEKLIALNKIKRNSYEKSMTWNMHAYVFFNQEKYHDAANAYEQVLKNKNLPASLAQTTYYSLSKLYLVQEKYDAALVSLDAWFRLIENPNPESYILKAQVLYQLERYNDALPEVKKAIALIKAKGQQPRENWLLIERAVYYQNRNYHGLERSLKDLVALYPKASYWLQLSAVYNELGKPAQELSVLESAYDQNMLTKESQLISLAQAFLSEDIPYKSARVMIQGMKDGTVQENAKNFRLLGDALVIAKEYDAAIDIMLKAANASQQGKDFFKLAQIHTERQEWNLALSSVQKSLDLGELKDKGNAYILKGLVLFNQRNLSEAKSVFKQAKLIDKKQKEAEQWLAYIDSEEKRLAYMAQVN